MLKSAMAGFVVVAACASAFAAPEAGKPVSSDDAIDIAETLAERIDLDRIDNSSIRIALEVLQEKIGYSILVDYRSLVNDDEGERSLFDDKKISLPTMKRVRMETMLRRMLDQVGADFYFAADHICVTTPAVKDVVCGPNRTLRDLAEPWDPPADETLERAYIVRHTPYVTMRFRDKPISEALSEMASRTGRTITLAADAADKARTTVSLALINAPFESAVTNVAEAAGLRAYRHGKTVIVVSAARAKAIEEPPDLPAGGFCCSLGSGCVVSLNELEAIARLIPQTRPAEASTSKPAEKLRLRQEEILQLQADNKSLEEKIKKLTEEMEKLRKK